MKRISLLIRSLALLAALFVSVLAIDSTAALARHQQREVQAQLVATAASTAARQALLAAREPS